MPELINTLFIAFLLRTATLSLRGTFASSAAFIVTVLRDLHGDCKRLQESTNSGLDDVLEQIARAEQLMLMNCFSSLTECRPLLDLLGQDKEACQQMIQELHQELTMLYTVFAEVCHKYIQLSTPEAFPAVIEGLEEISGLEWSGLFALALVRIGRHLEIKALGKIWSVSRELFVDAAGLSSSVLPAPTVTRNVRQAAQAVISHYVIVNGQRLASFFRNSIQNKNWMTVREPRSPSVLVETVILKEVHAFDAQLARILGDPRKPRPKERRPLHRFKDSMELEIERLVAKKLQVFAPIPFNRNGAIVGILRIAFKALYEYMREESFAKFGVQQIQVDCAFLAEVVRDFVESEDASALDSLLDETVSSASSRCEAPVLMDARALELLIAERKQVASVVET